MMETVDMTGNKQSEDSPNHLQLIILTESLFKESGELLVKFTPTTLCIMPPPASRSGAALRRPQTRSQNKTSVSGAVATGFDSGAIVQTLAAARRSFASAITVSTVVYGSRS